MGDGQISRNRDFQAQNHTLLQREIVPKIVKKFPLLSFMHFVYFFTVPQLW